MRAYGRGPVTTSNQMLTSSRWGGLRFRKGRPNGYLYCSECLSRTAP
jgi:hypothetical protein